VSISPSPKLLAIDASTDVCSVALALGGPLLEYNEQSPKSHTRVLLATIHRLLQEGGITLAELDCLAFGRGPGSFTGVRMACSVVQAFGFALQIPIVPVSTLRAVAEGAKQQGSSQQILATLDVGRGAVYWGLFEVVEGLVQPVSKEHIGQREEIVLPEGNWTLATGFPSAKAVASIAVVEYGLGNAMTAEQVEPVYLRENFVKKSST